MLEKVIKSWKDLQEIEEELFNSQLEGNLVIYRGQSVHNWKLESSISRIFNNQEIAENWEDLSKQNFASKFHLFNNSKNYELLGNEILMLMQHYSCPTRLLDWSKSLHIALYFAVNERLDTDGALYIWHPNTFYDAFQKSPNIKGKTAKELTRAEVTEMMSKIERSEQLTFLEPKKYNDRLFRQQGVFTSSKYSILKPHCDIINESEEWLKLKVSESSLMKIKIEGDLKREFLKRLNKMNINASMLYSGLDGLGKHIKDLMHIDSTFK